MKTKDLARVGLFSAIMAVLAQIQIPMPGNVPLTLQTFAVALAAYVLGVQKGTLSVGVYLLLGACGLPVFSGLSGGLPRFVAPAGGFLWGFLLLAVFCGTGKNRKIRWLLGLIGVLVCHVVGTAWYGISTNSGLWGAWLTASLPYLLKDILSVWLAEWIARRIIGIF